MKITEVTVKRHIGSGPCFRPQHDNSRVQLNPQHHKVANNDNETILNHTISTIANQYNQPLKMSQGELHRQTDKRQTMQKGPYEKTLEHMKTAKHKYLKEKSISL